MNLKKYGVGTTHICRGGNRLGIYFIEKGAVNRSSKVIYDRAHSAISEIDQGMIDWDSVFQHATWFHWTGITPAISQGAAHACREAIKKAHEKGITVSCDLNYRKKLWNYGTSVREVMPELVQGCSIVLGNEEDAEMALGIKPEGVDIKSGKVDAEAYLSVSKQIMEKFPKVEKVITTLRGSLSANHNTWSGTLYNGKKFFTAPTYDITDIVDRVGGGDSFMGGLIYGLLTYSHDDQKALDFAVAASSLKHTVHGDINLVTVDEVEKIISGDTSGRVSR
jgi:2-dehydro-3-deoxygluconokinase